MNIKNRFASNLQKGLIITSFIVAVFTCGETKAAASGDMDSIIHNISTAEQASKSVPSVNSQTESYLKILQSDGSFNDIDYADSAQTSWKPVAHVTRLRVMALAYTDSLCNRYQNEDLYNAIVSALQYWYDSNPHSTNWWYNVISWPQHMGITLCLMRNGLKKVPGQLETDIMARIKKVGKDPADYTGANKIDVAMQWIFRSVLQDDDVSLGYAVEQLYEPLTITVDEGLQSDYSFLQHNLQLSTAAYGVSIMSALTSAIQYLFGTKYSIADTNLENLSSFVRLAFLPAIRGQYFLYNDLGRGIARQGGVNASGSADFMRIMSKADSANEQTYSDANERMLGTKPAATGLVPFHRHFYRADYTLHQRKAYTMDVRMNSVRTCRTENGNGENLKGYFLADGGTQITLKGDEYKDIFPVWDWSHIPGTTVPAFRNPPTIEEWGQYGLTDFAGGVSDGVYGMTAFLYEDFPNMSTTYSTSVNTTAHKSWFFFDDEVVCLGDSIASLNRLDIHTTVNQCLLKGDVTARTSDGEEHALDKGEHAFSTLRWLHHDSIAYYFPYDATVNVSNQEQSGTWNSISSAISDTTTQYADVMKLWIDHGKKPTNDKYTYIIVPAVASISEAKNRLPSLTIINSDSVQAVYNPSLKLLEAVFYRKAELNLGFAKIRSGSPCTMMISFAVPDSLKIYVSDPTYSQDSVALDFSGSDIGDHQLTFYLDTTKMYSGITSSCTIPRFVVDDVAQISTEGNSPAVVFHNGSLYVYARTGERIMVYDLSGTTVYSENMKNSSVLRLPLSLKNDAVYIVKVGARCFKVCAKR